MNVCTVIGTSSVMASKAARDSIGVSSDAFVRITNVDRDTSIVRKLRKVHVEMLPVASKDILFVPVNDMNILGSASGDKVEVAVTDEIDEFP